MVKKMMLVPFDQNPTNIKLSGLDKDMNEVIRSQTMPIDEKVKRYNNVLSRYINNYNPNYSGLAPAVIDLIKNLTIYLQKQPAQQQESPKIKVEEPEVKEELKAEIKEEQKPQVKYESQQNLAEILAPKAEPPKNLPPNKMILPPPPPFKKMQPATPLPQPPSDWDMDSIDPFSAADRIVDSSFADMYKNTYNNEMSLDEPIERYESDYYTFQPVKTGLRKQSTQPNYNPDSKKQDKNTGINTTTPVGYNTRHIILGPKGNVRNSTPNKQNASHTRNNNNSVQQRGKGRGGTWARKSFF